MNFATSLLLLAFVVSTVVAFPIVGGKSSVRRDQYELYSSSQTDDNAADDPRALSGLLGEMFEAKLEMSKETKQLESLLTENSDMPVLGHDGIYRIVSQNQLE